MAEDERFPVKLFPTATATDVLFYIVVGRLDKRKIPSYGTRYNDITPRSEDWPHHRLVYVSSPDANGKQKWFFAADRENEDLYNWTLGQGEELIRTYLVRRDLYLQRSAVEAAAAPKQAGEFTYPVVATLDSKFAKYGFADDTVLEAPDELRSLYIVVKRRYLRPVVSEIIYDEQLELRIKRTFTIVPTTHTLPADALGAVYELEPVNTFHSREVKREVVPESEGWTLADYVRTQAVRTNIPNLPRELMAVAVVWNSSYSVGTQDYAFFASASEDSFSLGKSASDQASSSAAVTPDIQLKFRDVEASNLPATEYELMIPGNATEAAVIDRLNAILTPATVTTWPVFRPESVTISTTGQSINVSCNVGVSLDSTVSNGAITRQAADRSTSDDYRVTLSNNSVQLPPCIHDQITLAGGTSRSQLVAATAYMGMNSSLAGSISASLTKSGIAYGTVYPSVIPAIAGAQKTIPSSGLYALDIRPGRNFLGATLVTVTVLNANTLA
jgi:hypothetical protein